MALMSFPGSKAAHRYPLLVHRTDYFSIRYIISSSSIIRGDVGKYMRMDQGDTADAAELYVQKPWLLFAELRSAA